MNNNKNNSFNSERSALIFDFLKEVNSAIRSVNSNKNNDDIYKLWDVIYHAAALNDINGDISSFVLDKVKELGLFNKEEEKKFEEKLIPWGEKNNNKYNELRERRNKEGEDNFNNNLFSRTLYDKSFSNVQQSEIYRASVDAMFEQYKGEKQVNLTDVFMENIEKSGKFNDEEKKKLKEFSLQSEEAVKNVEKLSEDMKKHFDEKIKFENGINGSKNKNNNMKQNDYYDGFDSVLFDKVYSDKSFSGEQRGKIILASMDAMYAQYKDGKQVNLTEVFMESIEKSGKFNDEEKKKLKGFSLEAAEKVKDIDKVPERLVKNFEKALKFEEDLKKMNNINKANALNGSEYNPSDEIKKQKEELEKLRAEGEARDKKWREEQKAKDEAWAEKNKSSNQAINDMSFIGLAITSPSLASMPPMQRNFIYSEINSLMEQLKDNGQLSKRADVLLKESIVNNKEFSQYDKDFAFKCIEQYDNLFKNDERPGFVAKKETQANASKITETTNQNTEKNALSEYIESARNKMIKEKAPTGFAYIILCDMDKNPNISKETKDMFLNMAIKSSKEIQNQGLKMTTDEGVYAFAEVLSKKIKENKEFGEKGFEIVKDIMKNGESFNKMLFAKEVKNIVLNLGNDNQTKTDKKEEIKNDNKPIEVNKEIKRPETPKTEKTEMEAKLERVEKSDEYKNLINSGNFNDAQKDAIKLDMAKKLKSEYFENAKDKIKKENASIGFAYMILASMDENPKISQKTKDVFLNMAIKCSKEITAEGLKMSSPEGMRAMAEKISKEMKENKEFGDEGLKAIVDTFNNGKAINSLSYADKLKDFVFKRLNISDDASKQINQETTGLKETIEKSGKQTESITQLKNEKNEIKEKPVEEILVDKIIRNGSFSKEAQNEILNIAIEIEQAKLKSETDKNKTTSEAFMDKVINSDKISDKEKDELLKMSIKTENKEIEKTEGGKRLYFDENKKERFDQLKLSDKALESLEAKVENGKFSVKIPENDEIKKEVIRSIKVQEGIENIRNAKRDEKATESKPTFDNNMTTNMAKFMASHNQR
ncbi:MAG: hypothetical protein IKW58_02175 [Alphaproteobacteria bacterium]|nr:hypothetical protein [Alphaproteobacteria bacterium]